MSEQFRIIEYPLIILFVVIGGVFLISSCDLISIFLSIELQSYGLYILCAVYRNSERATSGGLTYFLLGGLSSCFILLASSLLYGNSGNTSFDGLYVINNISNINEGLNANDGHNSIAPLKSSLDSLYESYYINFSLVIMSVGFLFKVSAAPFHF
jgi:NADH-ubiquinone oxidoreductase chain 2